MVEEDEIWADVIGYVGYYQVSNYGRVKSLSRYVQYTKNGNVCERWHRERILKPEISKRTGYLYVNLYTLHSKKHCTIHRLVAEAFIPNTDNLPCVNHLDEDRTNNRADNLEWITNVDNLKYSSAWKKGVQNRRCYSGSNNPFYGKHHTDEIKKICGKATRGKIAVNDGYKRKMIYPNELDKYLNLGYVRGDVKRVQTE